MSIPFYREPNEVLIPNMPRSTVVVTQPVAFTPPPPVSEWTWANQGLTVAEDAPGGIRFNVEQNDTDTFTVLERELPTAPYTITAAFKLHSAPNFLMIGLILFNSETLVSKVLEYANFGSYFYGPSVQYFSDFDTLDSSQSNSGPGLEVVTPVGAITWYRIANDLTHLTYSVSQDGELFLEIYKATVDEFTDTEDSFGFVCKPSSSFLGFDNSYNATLLSLEITTP